MSTAIGPDLAIVARQWAELSGRPLMVRRTNRLEDRCERLDTTFFFAAECAFEDPTFLDRAARLSAQWLARCNCETTRAIAGYVAYLRKDFARAATCFLACIAENPQNLDNWVDLAFALNHQGNPLGRHILFNHDEYIRRFAASGERMCTLSRLASIRASICADGADYSQVWPQWFMRVEGGDSQ